MGDHRDARVERRGGARRAAWARPALDATPVARGLMVVDDRLRPVTRHNQQRTGDDMRVDPTRVSGPIRLVLEPMLWMAFVSGAAWLLVALDPGLRDPAPGVVLYQHTLPLAILVGALLLISTITALMWLPTSTTATRARTSFAGLGMLASGWLFAKLDPVESGDFLALSWLSIGVGVLLVTICAVPWPTAPARLVHRRGVGVWAAVTVLSLVAAAAALAALDAARTGLVGTGPGEQTGWDLLMPCLALTAGLLAAVRAVLRLPARDHAG